VRVVVLWCALTLGPAALHQPASAQLLSFVGGTARASSSEHDGTRQGRLFGARITLDLASRLTLRLGPDYAERNLPALAAGAPAPGQFLTIAYETSYLEIPVLLGIAPMPTARVSPHLLVGVALGVRLGCQVQSHIFTTNAFGQITTISDAHSDCDTDVVGRSANALQVDARIGVGADINVVDPVTASVEVVYGAGIFKIFEAFAAKPRASFIRVGVGIPL
jgi:hypothetical protein